MTRNERIRKIANAVKAYRGSYNEKTGKWFRSPQPAKRQAIVKHLIELYRPHMSDAQAKDRIQLDAMMIEAFNHRTQFDKWIKSLADFDKPTTTP